MEAFVMSRPQPMLVGVLMGGPSAEHDISMATGRAIAIALGYSRHCVRVVTIGKGGAWQVLGRIVEPGRALAGVDVVFLALHGEWGEDGQVQGMLDAHGIRYTGSGQAASVFAMDKAVSRDIFRTSGLRVPRSLLVTQDQKAHFHDVPQILHMFSEGPWVVKPVSRGSSVGVSIVDDVVELPLALDHAFSFQNRALVEEYIDGVEVSCGVLEDAQGDPYALPVTEIRPPKERYRFFDYTAKYSGQTQEFTPARLAESTTRAVQDAAVTAYRALGCRHYARVDMILVGETPTVLELNTLPGLTNESLVPKQVQTLGYSFLQLLEHVLERAMYH